ncbi:MAG: hypothetical protein E7001_01620 [Coriobacteriaceae bacterium]|nr:hypothetical protein [Coriobacteriaceae bacterium]
MERILCGASAFQYHRIPPLIREMLPGPECLGTPIGREALMQFGVLDVKGGAGLFSSPLHILTERRGACSGIQGVKGHFLPELPGWDPFGPQHEELSVSPLLALATMARSLSVPQLCMAMYELCGTFTVFSAPACLDGMIDEISSAGGGRCHDDWKPVRDASGRPTALWRRPALLDVSDLERASSMIEGMHGCKKFKRAASLVRGVAASPFEVQAAMLLSFPRSLGGAGINPVQLNVPIQLTRAAQRISGKSLCYGDIVLEPRGQGQTVVVECQSALIHDRAESYLSDAGRTTALESMGYNVVLLTSRQLYQRQTWDEVVRHIARGVGARLAPKGRAYLEREQELRRQILIDWATLGM